MVSVHFFTECDIDKVMNSDKRFPTLSDTKKSYFMLDFVGKYWQIQYFQIINLLSISEVITMTGRYTFKKIYTQIENIFNSLSTPKYPN